MTIETMKRANELQAKIKEMDDQIERSEMDIDEADCVTLIDRCTKQMFNFILDNSDDAATIREVFKRRALSLKADRDKLVTEFNTL